MSESIPTIPNNESFEVLPTEEQVFDAIKEICGSRVFTEVNRTERGGKLRELDIRLEGLDENGQQVQLEYTVNKKGEAAIDVTYYDPGKGFDYHPGMGYNPEDIVSGAVMGRFVDGVWQSENTL